jgi:hypothetical protein
MFLPPPGLFWKKRKAQNADSATCIKAKMPSHENVDFSEVTPYPSFQSTVPA